jgi:hypothetical protein
MQCGQRQRQTGACREQRQGSGDALICGALLCRLEEHRGGMMIGRDPAAYESTHKAKAIVTYYCLLAKCESRTCKRTPDLPTRMRPARNSEGFRWWCCS